MHEILFRGKRKDNGEWVEGYYLQIGDVGKLHYILTGKLAIKNGAVGFEQYEVIPETVGQFTGMEANGKKVFEGDIVKYEAYVFQCKWNEYNYEYVFDDGEEDFGIGYTSPYEVEIIGNIHDNPELLKGGDG